MKHGGEGVRGEELALRRGGLGLRVGAEVEDLRAGEVVLVGGAGVDELSERKVHI